MRKITPAMLAVLEAMARGATLRGSGLGDAHLNDGWDIARVAHKTHAALIRRGMVVRSPLSQWRVMDGWLCNWQLTDTGRDTVRDEYEQEGGKDD